MPVKLFGETARQLFTILDDRHSSTFTVDVGEVFEGVTLDVIGKAGFGKKNPSSFFITHAQCVFLFYRFRLQCYGGQEQPLEAGL